MGSRVIHETERTLRRGSNVPRTKRNKNNKNKVGGQKHKTREMEILDTPDAPSTPLDETIPVDSIPESGVPLNPPLQISYGVLITPTLLTSMFQPADVWSDAHSLCTKSPH